MVKKLRLCKGMYIIGDHVRLVWMALSYNDSFFSIFFFRVVLYFGLAFFPQASSTQKDPLP